MAAIFYSRLCIRNSGRLASSLGRPVFTASTISCSPRIHSEIAPSQPSSHWKFERYVSVALLTLIPAGVIYPSAAVDWALAAVIPLHNHWGVGQVLTDYIHGSTMPKIAKGLWLAVSILQFIGLCYFNYSDIGICKAVSMIWHM
ncbi:succinate dehydrogenase [ubiquinone] cytochrome b small subunit, mitochondrial-like isoform X2 [Porites lutea]|uniref:succinate dehydrogenase [ubiquinone] cytochrome b small subunit, mitochondrial-like isoform X2 n=1 Tax=Porites lutea TaxID=51062 RepID=UPI003CC5F03D